MKRLLAFNLLFVLTTALFAQGNDKELRQKFNDAEYFFLYEDYEKALPLYSDVFDNDPNNFHACYKIGLCYLNLPLKRVEATSFLEMAANNVSPKYKDGSYKEKGASIDAIYFLGVSHHLNWELSEAIDAYERYKNELDVKEVALIERTERAIASCQRARELTKESMSVEVENIGHNVNTNYAEFNPAVSDNDSVMFYTKANVWKEQAYEDKGISEANVYNFRIMRSFKTDGVWQEPDDITAELNTEKECVTLSTSKDGKTLLLYRDEFEYGDINDFEQGTIYISTFENGTWKPIQKLSGGINSASYETHACISSDGETIYFTSNRKGGLGGLDIYKSTKQENGIWSEAENMGDHINTPHDEESPFIVNDSILYFSSDGHDNMGGFDVFYSKLSDDGKWSVPTNVGIPVNSPADDLFFVPIKGGSEGYYAVSRPDGYLTFGKEDIFHLKILEDPKNPQFTQPVDTIELADSVAFTDSVEFENAKIASINKGQSDGTSNQTGDATSTGNNENINKPNDSSTTAGTENKQPETSEPQVTNLVGAVNLADENIISSDLTIQLVDKKTGKVVSETKPDQKTGEYSLKANSGDYNLVTKSENYVNDTLSVSLSGENTKVNVKMTRKEVASGEYFMIKAVFFRVNSSTIDRSEQIKLEKLSRYMTNNPQLYVEVVGHADSQGSKDYNLELSQKRSRAVIEYLTGKEIPSDRFISSAQGEDDNIATNSTEAGRKLNRRVEIKITKAENLEVDVEAVYVPEDLKKKVNRYSVIFVRSTTKMPITVFDKLAEEAGSRVFELKHNKEYIYYAGDYKDEGEALKLQQKAEELGFADAQRTDYYELNKMSSFSITSEETEIKQYSVQIGASMRPLQISKYYKGLEGVNEHYGKDGFYRYTFGLFDNKEAAEKLQQSMIKRGYTDAFIVNANRYTKLKNTKPSPVSFTIQFFALSKPVAEGYFKKVDDVEEIKADDGLYHYIYGDFPSWAEAEKAIEMLEKKGFKGMYIKNKKIFK